MICLMVRTVNHQRMSHCLRSTGDLIIIYKKKHYLTIILFLLLLFSSVVARPVEFFGARKIVLGKKAIKILQKYGAEKTRKIDYLKKNKALCLKTKT